VRVRKAWTELTRETVEIFQVVLVTEYRIDEEERAEAYEKKPFWEDPFVLRKVGSNGREY
jgi:hypothetical protein